MEKAPEMRSRNLSAGGDIRPSQLDSSLTSTMTETATTRWRVVQRQSEDVGACTQMSIGKGNQTKHVGREGLEEQMGDEALLKAALLKK